MYTEYRGMHIDEEKELLNISDHCLAKAWFKVGRNTQTNWKKAKMKEIHWIKKDEESLQQYIHMFKPKIGKNTSFKRFMEKMKSTLNTVLKKKKRFK